MKDRARPWRGCGKAALLISLALSCGRVAADRTTDRILGKWMRRAEEDGATLIVSSDPGFKWGSDRSCERGSLNPDAAGFWHRLDGVFAAWEARVRPGPTRGSASVVDVPPTVSVMLGLPADRRAPGTPIRAAFGRTEGS